MPKEHVIAIDPHKPLSGEPNVGHNRWHEAIEPVVEIDPADLVVYETRDAFDGQLDASSSAQDVGKLNLNPVHPLTGPVYVKGAEPGDLLEAELVAIEADPWEQWGYTVEVPGFGFLRDYFPDPYIVHWRLHGNGYADSEQLPGVRKDGTNESEDLTVAARNALLNMIEHLGTRGFERQQAYAICSVAVDLRINQTVDIPNPLVSALLPLDIFM